jgi:acyl-homoserine-lactone acylase
MAKFCMMMFPMRARSGVGNVVCHGLSILLWSVFLLMGPEVQARGLDKSTIKGAVEIRRTADGIPHLRAADWRELGIGIGYVQAQDALCTLAEGFVTYEGRRSWFFGAEARPELKSSVGQPKNIDSDFFFRVFADEAVVERYQSAQPPELKQMIDGFAAGYNRFLHEARRQPQRYAYRTCLREPWVREISSQDVYRRMYSSQVRAGYGQFVTELVNAKPGANTKADAGSLDELRVRLAGNLGDDRSLGSNAIAWGAQATGGDGAVLFGNPHWFWGGPDRFYQMHLTIPGKLNVAGVSFLGVPLVMIGFNDQIAWSHTVSSTRRFGLFELTLDPSDPRRYMVDGVSEAMQERVASIDVRTPEGESRKISRTFYSTRYGPVLGLGEHHETLGWNSQHVLAIRDVNAENVRSYRNFLAWGRAASLDEFIDIQRREVAMPWVNTIAIGRNDGRVLFADVGAVPNTPDDLRRTCTTPAAKALANLDARIPVLDGSRARCNWLVGEQSIQPGAMPADRQPHLLREDYVANMNDSYWLSNVSQPLTGFASIFGGEGDALGMRGRLGHLIAIELLQEGAASSEILGRRVMHEVLNPRVFSAERFKPVLLDQACSGRAATRTEVQSNLDRACRILRAWPNTAEAGDRGVLLWEAFWSALERLVPEALFQVPFSSDAPLSTPATPLPGQGKARQALVDALEALSKQGIAMDAAVGEVRHINSGGRRWPMYGACGGVGTFTPNCPRGTDRAIGPNAISNSYLQVVHFGKQGVEAYTLLAHGQDELAVANGRGAAPVARYARKAWLRFPFREQEIRADPALERLVLRDKGFPDEQGK